MKLVSLSKMSTVNYRAAAGLQAHMHQLSISSRDRILNERSSIRAIFSTVNVQKNNQKHQMNDVKFDSCPINVENVNKPVQFSVSSDISFDKISQEIESRTRIQQMQYEINNGVLEN
jgi:hypothetical protein